MQIEHISNINYKSFNNYTSNSNLKYVNIFFGTNGSGKSSLAEWLYQKNINKSLLFDTEYIRNNVQAVDEITGVAIQVGPQIQHEEKITETENKIQTIKSEIDDTKDELDNNRKALLKILDETLKKGKIKFQTTKINQKQNAKISPETAYSAWKTDASRKGLSSNDVDLTSLEEEQKQIANMLSLLKPVCSESDQSLLKQLPSLLSQQTNEPKMELTHDLIQWLREGLKLHNTSKSNETCLFCGNKFDAIITSKNILKEINSTYADTLDKLSDIKNIINKINELIPTIPVQLDSLIELYKTESECAISVISQKEANITKSIDYDNQIIELIQKINSKIEAEEYKQNNRTQQINQIFNQKEVEAKSWIGREILKNELAVKLKSNIDSQKEIISNKEKELEKENVELAKLKSYNTKTAAFAKLANDSLESSGATFHLTPSSLKDQYDIESKNGHLIKSSDLSEGEMRLLAFMHFYYSLFLSLSDNDYNFRPDLKTIIIDDPITSLDADNRYVLTNAINKVIAKLYDGNKDIQLFIFTHSSMDFHDFSYRFSNFIGQFIISKDIKGNSLIKEIGAHEIKNFSDYYRSTLQELFSFSEVKREDISSIQNAIQYANKMRFVIETHARTHYQIENVTANVRELNHIENVYGIVTDKERTAFSQSLDVINSLSHGISFTDEFVNTKSPKGIQDAIRCIICVLFRKDPEHILCMYGDDGPDRAAFKKKILQWSGHILG